MYYNILSSNQVIYENNSQQNTLTGNIQRNHKNRIIKQDTAKNIWNQEQRKVKDKEINTSEQKQNLESTLQTL